MKKGKRGTAKLGRKQNRHVLPYSGSSLIRLGCDRTGGKGSVRADYQREKE